MMIEIGGKQLRGDLIVSASLRSDLSPIPVTFEGDFRADGELSEKLKEGKTFKVAGDEMIVIKHKRIINKSQQGGRIMDVVRVIAVLKGVEELAFVRKAAIVKEKKQFSECLKSCGVKLPVDGDFQVPRFTVMVGYIPTYQVAMVLQEEGRVFHWDSKTKKLKSTRLIDFKSKQPIDGLKITGSQEDESQFLEKHTVPWFYSIKDDASVIHGNKEKPRNTNFVPKKSPEQLQNMTRALILKEDVRIVFSGTIKAGDVIQLTTGKKRVVMTAVHVFKSGTDGHVTQEDYTRLYLGEVKQ